MIDLTLVFLLACTCPFVSSALIACNPYQPADVSYQYEYDSSVAAFTESIAKSIFFMANFTLQCDHYDDSEHYFRYSIIVHKIITKMQSSDKRKKSSAANMRRRKVPAPFKMSATMDPVSNKVKVTDYQTRLRRSAEQENVWYDLVAPDELHLSFKRLLNGTITQINLPKNASEVTSGLLKTLALLFNINRNTSRKIVLENDDLGQHYSQYTFTRQNDGDTRYLMAEKNVQPDDFNRNQFDSVNAGKIAVRQRQIQVLNYDTLQIVNITGKVSTTTSDQTMATTSQQSQEERILSGALFQVDASYSLISIKTNNFRYQLNDYKNAEMQTFDFSNFDPQSFDETSEMQKVLIIKEGLLRGNGSWQDVLKFVVDEVRLKKDKEANLLRAALVLESTLFVKRKKNSKPIFDAMLPLVTKAFVEHLETNNFDVVFRLLYVLSGAHGDEVNQIFLGCFTIRTIMENEPFRRQFFNALIQLQFPNDLLLDRVFQEFETLGLKNVFKTPKDANTTRRSYHAMISVGKLLIRPTIGQHHRAKVLRWFSTRLQHLFDGGERCRSLNDAKFLYEPLFDAVSNFMTPELAELYPDMLNSTLVWKILEISQQCYSEKQPEFSLTALQALRKLFHVEPISGAISRMVVVGAKSCHHRVDILNELINRMDSDERLKLQRFWPRFGIIRPLDSYVAEQFILFMDQRPTSFDCSRLILVDYLKRKKGRQYEEMFEEVAENYYRWRNGSVFFALHKRSKRQGLGSLLGGGLGGGTGGGSTGSGNSSALTPETVAECRTWDSQIGRNYKQIYSNPGTFDVDVRSYGTVKQHCLFDLSFKFQSFLSIGIQAGFFSGKNNVTRQGRLFGKAWAGLTLLGAPQDFAFIQFSRYQATRANIFQGEVKLSAFGTVYMDEKQDRCNLTFRSSLQPLQWTVPAFRVAFGGFTFLMTADFAITLNTTLYPSYCGADGEMGAKFFPSIVAEASAYAELENDFFGMGMLAAVNVNYYFDAQLSVPTGCLYIYHGNSDMFVKFDFYIKLPSFVFLNTNVQAVTIRQPWPIFTWQLMIKKSGRYVLLGFCLPSTFIVPEAVIYYNTKK